MTTAPPDMVASDEQALVLLKSERYSDMEATITALEAIGAHAMHVIPPRGIIARIPFEVEGRVLAIQNVGGVHRGPAPAFASGDGVDLATAAGVWNYMLTPRTQQPGQGRPLIGDAFPQPDSGRVEGTSAVTGPPGTYETSSFLLRKVAVGVILPESNGSGENWSTSRQDTVFNEIVTGLNWWVTRGGAAASLTFYYDKKFSVPTQYEPITRSGWSDENVWVTDIFQNMGYTSGDNMQRARSYINGLRNTLNTDWCFTYIVVDSLNDPDGTFTSGYFAYAYLGGPYVIMTYDNDGWGIGNMDLVATHEAGHIFLAGDEYCQPGYACCDFGYYGYLNVYNGNCEDGNPSSLPCVMRSNEDAVCQYTNGQIGWRDSDSDGKPDPIDNVVSNTLYPYPTPTPQTTLTLTGLAKDVPYDSPTETDVTINKISAVKFRVDTHAWADASAADGTFNQDTEAYTLTTPALSLGTHRIETQAYSTSGNTSTISWQDVTVSTLAINPPYDYTWCMGQSVSDCLSASGGIPPYHDWTAVASAGDDYTYAILGSSSFSPVGIAKGWRADDGTWSYTLPFTFPLYGSNRTSVNVCSNGFLDFTSTTTDYSNTSAELISSVRIAPLWDDLYTGSGDIYVDESVSGQVTIRWQGVTYSGSYPVNFAAVLFSDGRIRFDYGSGNTGLTPTVGISSGNGTNYVLVPGYDTASSLTNASSVLFTPTGGGSPLPPGVSLDDATGCFYGAPTTAGDYSAPIQVSDSSSPASTAQQTFTFHVATAPQQPTSPSAIPATICVGGSSTLSATPGSGGDTIAWYSGSCGGTYVGTGASLPVSPTSTTTYYAKTQNSTTGCLSPSCAAGVTVTVNTVPATPGLNCPSLQPTNGDWTDNQAFTFTFSSDTATSYEYQWDTSPIGSGPGTPITSPHSFNSGPVDGYYYHVRAGNDCGWSSYADLGPYRVNTDTDNIASIRGATGSKTLRGIVTAKFADFMYVESADRSSGVAVTTVPPEVAVGDRIWFTGNTALVDGQKQVTPTTPIVVLSRENALPELGMRHRDVGGVDYYNTWTATTGYDVGSLVVPTIWNGSRYACTVAGASGATEPGQIPPGGEEEDRLPPWPSELNATVVDGTVTWQNVGWDYIANPAMDPGVYRGRGPLNVGLLVTVSGLVTYSDDADSPTFFYIWDGSNMCLSGEDPRPLDDGTGYRGLRIDHSGWLSVPDRAAKAYVDWVTVNGIVVVKKVDVGLETIYIPAVLPKTVTLNAAYTAHTAWAATTAYALNATRVPTVANGHWYNCTVAGTSAATEPEWPTTVGGTVVDGTATWTESGTMVLPIQAALGTALTAMFNLFAMPNSPAVPGPGIVPYNTWAASTAYDVGNVVIPTVPNTRRYACIVAGTSGATEPVWPGALGATVVDGTVTWKNVGWDYNGDPSGPLAWECPQVLGAGDVYRLEYANKSLYLYDMWSEPNGAFGGMLLGDGYWVLLDNAWAVSYTGLAQEIPQWIASSAPEGWMQMALPQDHNTDTTQIMMSDGGVVKSLQDASQWGANWVGSTGYWWNNQDQSGYDIGLPDDSPFTTTMTPWHGYQFLVHEPNRAWIIP